MLWERPWSPDRKLARDRSSKSPLEAGGNGQGREEKVEGVKEPGAQRQGDPPPGRGLGLGQGLEREPRDVGLLAGLLF